MSGLVTTSTTGRRIVRSAGLVLLGLLASPTTLAQEPTFHGQIIRLFQNKCLQCHHEGGIAPTDWSNYDTVYEYRQQIRGNVSTRKMPPWNAAAEEEQGFPAGQGFLPHLGLTQEQIDLVVGWVLDGAPEGDPADAPPPLTFDDSEWFQGDPDIILEMPVTWEHNPGPDRYRCFILDPPGGALEQDLIITSFEVKPSNLEITHHSVVYIADREEALAMQAADTTTPEVANDGWDCFGDSMVSGATVLSGWAPGANSVSLLNDELGIYLPADKVIVNQMHYHYRNENEPSSSAGKGTGGPEFDRTQIGIKVSLDPTILTLNSYLPTELPGLTTPAISGPALSRNSGYGPQLPGETNVYDMDVPIPATAHLLSIFPHMHLIGDKFEAVAKLPGNVTIPLIYLDKWDFDWQLNYNYKRPIALPAGSIIHFEGTYTNTSPVPVIGGLFSDQEMLTLGISLSFDEQGVPTPRDSTPPRVVSDTFAEDGDTVTVTVTFNEPIATPHFPSTLDVFGPHGRVQPPNSIDVAGNVLSVIYDKAKLAPEAGGKQATNELILRGFFGIKDLIGNFLDGNENGIGGELEDDVVVPFQGGIGDAPPVLHILGSDPAAVDAGEEYIDPGATATDDVDGVLTLEIVVTNNVDTSVAGEYSVVYEVTDSAGNTVSEERIVIVGGTPEIGISPTDILDFGPVPLGSFTDRLVTVVNTGFDTLTGHAATAEP
ncbi:MAG: immunoglobulin-like domain-containing protein, partial [Candidatus Hydrogenedentota bacterium]